MIQSSHVLFVLAKQCTYQSLHARSPCRRHLYIERRHMNANEKRNSFLQWYSNEQSS
jgi:hypothetical protein